MACTSPLIITEIVIILAEALTSKSLIDDLPRAYRLRLMEF